MLNKLNPCSPCGCTGQSAEDKVLLLRCVCGQCGAPAVVGFAGKRQWMELLNVGRKGRDKYTRLEHGIQQMRPQARTYPSRICQSMSSQFEDMMSLAHTRSMP